MLMITLQRDKEDRDDKIGNYTCTVSISGLILARFRVEGHRRYEGWKNLLHMMVDQIDREEDVETWLKTL
jgi:hypothetical protein